MEVNANVSKHNRIRVEKRNKSGIVDSFSFDNIVLDDGIANINSRIITTDSYQLHPNFLYLGTGTTEPQPTDTGLEAISPTLAGKASSNKYATQSDDSVNSRYIFSLELTFEYAEGEAEGVWAELGLAFGSSYTSPYNRALFRDDQGNAVSLQVLSDEFLTVYVDLSIYVPYFSTTTWSYDGTTHSMVPYWDNPASFQQNVWVHGFPFSVRSFGTGDSFEGNHYHYYASNTTKSIDSSTNTSTYYIEIPPGNQSEIQGIFLRNSNGENCVRGDFSPHVIKPADHKMNFSISITFNIVSAV